jgi:hypothetical protein
MVVIRDWTESSALQVSTSLLMIDDTGASESREPSTEFADHVTLGHDASDLPPVVRTTTAEDVVLQQREHVGDRGFRVRL